MLTQELKRKKPCSRCGHLFMYHNPACGQVVCTCPEFVGTKAQWGEKGHVYKFDGPTYQRWRDGERLSTQLDKVREWALSWTWTQRKSFKNPHNWAWFTLEECAEDLGYGMASVASISSKLRDLRKRRHGTFRVLSRFKDKGLWEYLVIPHELRLDAIGLKGCEGDGIDGSNPS